MKKEDYCMWMGPFIVQAGACLCPCFNSERDFNSVKLHLPGDGVFVCLGLQLRFIYFVHQTYGMCTVCFCRSDEWAKYTHSICDYISSSPVLRGPARSWRCFFFPFFCLHRFFLPTLFLFCHILFSLLQPFVIHDMKSLMEGEQFINCKQLPNPEHHQQTSALTFGHGG